jgi:hypothetical protein
MKLLRFIKQEDAKLLILTIIILITASVSYPQIRIGGITIPEVKIPKGKKKTEPKPEANTGTNQNGSNKDNSTETKTGQDDPIARFAEGFAYDINEAKGDVDIWEIEGRAYFVRSTHQKWLAMAVSQKVREAFAIEKKFNDWRKANPSNKFDTALNELAAAAAKKLPLYIPHNNNFAIKDAGLETMMKGKLKNAATAKIIKIGMFHANWQIEKNDIGIPKNRYREGFIWAKDSADDHNYCHLYGFVIQQDYSGGGSYGATFAYLNTDTLFGCPAK